MNWPLIIEDDFIKISTAYLFLIFLGNIMDESEKHFEFKDNYLLLTTIFFLFVLLVYVMAARFLGQSDMEWLAICVFGGVVVLRIFFLERSPKKIIIFSREKYILVFPRWPGRNVRKISMNEISSVDRSITIGKFPMIRLFFHVRSGEGVELFFRPAVKRSGFFSFPAEGFSTDFELFFKEINKHLEK